MRFPTIAVVLAGLALPATAFAQEPTKAELAKARTLFQEGVALASANNCAAALVKYKEVAQVKMTPQVAFNTAECEARLGQLVAALGNYRVAASQAADDRNAGKVLREVPSRIDELEGRIPKLTVTRGKGADTATILLDGSELGSRQLGNPVPVDPGSHTIVAKVGGKEYLHENVKLGEKESKTFDVKISVAAPVIEPPAPDQPPGDQPQKPPEGSSRAPGAVVTVIGGLSLVVGLAMLAPRQSAINKLNMDCTPDGHCPTGDQSTIDQGKLFTGVTEVMVPVGVVGIVVGAVLLAKSGPPKAEKKPSDEERKEGDAEKKDAFWRSIQVVSGVPGATVGGLSLIGRF
jgi:hypothetical protein